MAEEIYQQSPEIELDIRGIAYVSKVELDVYYKNNLLNAKYRPDLLVFGGIVVELKALGGAVERPRGSSCL